MKATKIPRSMPGIRTSIKITNKGGKRALTTCLTNTFLQWFFQKDPHTRIQILYKEIVFKESCLTYLDCRTNIRSLDTATPPLSSISQYQPAPHDGNFQTAATTQLFTPLYLPSRTCGVRDSLSVRLPSAVSVHTSWPEGSVMWHKYSFFVCLC